MVNKIAQNLKEFFDKAGKKKAVLGLSGGIDSALTAKIAVIALGKENVTALILPNDGLTGSEHVDDAKSWAEALDIQYEIISINKFIDQYEELPWKSNGFSKMNIQARARATILYHYANTHNALVLGTGNKTELILGYFTKYGDGACDCEVIGNLYKTDVWQLSEELGLPERIIKKTPSAGLEPGQNDEDEIGMEYNEIDKILKKFEQGKKPETGNEKNLWARIQTNKHKSSLPPVI